MKQQIMYESIITATSSVSKLSADILAVRIDMNIMSHKLEKKFNEIIALLATTQTPSMPSSPSRKVARGTNTSRVKHAASNKTCRSIWRSGNTEKKLSHRRHHRRGKSMQKRGQIFVMKRLRRSICIAV
jgi:hypothetical protein